MTARPRLGVGFFNPKEHDMTTASAPRRDENDRPALSAVPEAAEPTKAGGFFRKLGRGTMQVLEGLAEAQAARNTGPAPLVVEADTVDQLLRLARLERGMSIEQLSQLTSISDWRLERYEGATRQWSMSTPSVDELVRIKTVLNISTASVAKFI